MSFYGDDEIAIKLNPQVFNPHLQQHPTETGNSSWRVAAISSNVDLRSQIALLSSPTPASSLHMDTTKSQID
ncbi:hypothetical protein E2C01_015535 [Portunus trituberculatus]|uniref:Uncharacterized protein n=1 Tax=Portunus trituberculatus TaxID=210409 RepID=A0A5B7DM60_PORTR|nr:hypothetical protein [Portunus trituberculatus]